jgi:hypothetical protein
VLCPHTGARLIVPVDHGKDATPRYSFQAENVPEPSPSTDSIYDVPVPQIDSRAISFEIQRRTMQLVNDMGDIDLEDNFDLLDCLESPMLSQLDPTLKTYIREFLSADERADLKAAILDHQEWITEYNPAASACLMCNTAIYPMGLG